MSDRHAARPRLVVDNSRRIGSGLEQTVRHRNLTITAEPENPMVNPLGECSICPPVANRAWQDATEVRGCCGATKSIDNFAHGGQGDIGHIPLYSDGLNYVKARKTESFWGSFPASIQRLLRVRRMNSTETLPFPTGARLVAARLALGKNQRALCKLLNVEANTWNQWEKGKHKPDVDAMTRLADLYGISLDWIYRERADTLPGPLAELVLGHFEKLLAAAALVESA